MSGRRFMAAARLAARQRMPYIVVALLTAALTMLDWVTDPTADPYSLLIGAVHLAAVLCVPLAPEPAALALMLIEVVCCFHYADGGPSRLWGGCLSVGILTYQAATISATIIILLCVSALQLLQSITAHPDMPGSGPDLGSSAFILGMLTICAAAGYVTRQIIDRQQEEHIQHQQALAQQESRHQERTLAHAAQVHDSLAARLAAINLLAQRHISDQPHPCSQDWNTIQQQASTGLTELHTIIARMTGPDPSSADRSDSYHALISHINDVCSTLKQRLSSYHGDIQIHDFGPSCDPKAENVSLLIDTLQELVSNILRHGEKNGKYEIDIVIHDTIVDITQSNSMQAHIGSQSTGAGLSVYRQRVRTAHGTLEAVSADGEWQVHATIPLTSPARPRQSV